jgi:hypothetical protein
MGRAQAAYRPSLDHSCSLDRFAIHSFLDDGRASRALCTDAAGTGEVLPASAPTVPPSNDKQNSEDSDSEVVLGGIWYCLSRDDQIQFGGCFSRMILKMLNRHDGLSGEDIA